MSGGLGQMAEQMGWPLATSLYCDWTFIHKVYIAHDRKLWHLCCFVNETCAIHWSRCSIGRNIPVVVIAQG